jgi:AcrR family transcriptional regulator
MAGQVDNKQDQIIEAALKRFSHFGISKTTMNEIAEDLSISKALLYYYFPDKTSLVLEVGKHILSGLVKEQTSILKNSKDFRSGLNGILDARIDFGKKYFMMHIGDIQSSLDTNDPRFVSVMNEVKAKELEMISSFINEYKDKGQIKNIDTEETAQVLIDTVTGIWICEIHINNKQLIPTEEQFEKIKQKNKLVTNIFHDGIKSN